MGEAMTAARFRAMSPADRQAYLDAKLYQQLPYAEPPLNPDHEACYACGRVDVMAAWCGHCQRRLCPPCASDMLTHRCYNPVLCWVIPDPDDTEAWAEIARFEKRRVVFGAGVLPLDLQAEVRQRREAEAMELPADTR